MLKTLRRISMARDFRSYDQVGYLDAVFASTSPARWMDIERADAAVDAVRKLHGDVSKYYGMWIAGGWLGGLPYEKSQRKGIVDRFLERGVNPNHITQIDGKNTVDIMREMLKLRRMRGGEVINIGIASYPLHIARFNLALDYAQRDGYGRHLEIVGIPISYENRPNTDSKRRPLNDKIFGWLGLVKDAKMLEKYGFSESLPDKSSPLHRKLRELNSEDRKNVR